MYESVFACWNLDDARNLHSTQPEKLRFHPMTRTTRAKRLMIFLVSLHRIGNGLKDISTCRNELEAGITLFC